MVGQNTGDRLSFDSDLAVALPFPLRSVPVVDTIDRASFRREHQVPGRPLILTGATRSFPAVDRWQHEQRLLELVPPERTVYCRQRADPNEEYVEDYAETTFGALVADVFSVRDTPHYLTQGLVHRACGMNRMLLRARYPAFLDELAVDCPLPPLFDRRQLVEGVLWLGCGGQVTPLHFDESENLNVTVRGRKRWLLFPPSEAKNLLLPHHEGRGTVVSSLEMLADGSGWLGGTVKRAYVCETGPGEMLYVPTGYLHQVYSSPEPNIAVNFWFIEDRHPRIAVRQLMSVAHARFGLRQPLKSLVGAALVAAMIGAYRLKYVLRRGRVAVSAPSLGPTTYGIGTPTAPEAGAASSPLGS